MTSAARRTFRRSGRSTALLIVLLLTGGGFLLAACVEERPASDATTSTERAAGPQLTATETELPPETPPPTDPPGLPEPSTGGGLSTRTLLLLGGLVVAAIAVFTVATHLAKARPRTSGPRTPLHAQLTEVIGGARWIHDAGSVEVLLTDGPDQTRTGWSEVRRRLVAIENQIATLAIGTGDPALDANLRYLGRCLADLRQAEEAYVAAKVHADGSARRDERLAHADETVLARRQHLQAAIEPVANTLRG